MARHLIKHIGPVFQHGCGNSLNQRIVPSNLPSTYVRESTLNITLSVFHGRTTSRSIFQATPYCSRVIREAGQRPAVSSHKYKKKVKLPVKEFTIKGKTKDHDLSIKLTKIQNLLEKGKTIEIFIKHNSDSQQDKSIYVSEFQKKAEDHLRGVMTKLRMDFTNESTTKLTIIPSQKADVEEPNSDNENKNVL